MKGSFEFRYSRTRLYIIERHLSPIRSQMKPLTGVVGPAIPGLRAVPDLVPIHPILPPTVHIHL